METSASAYLFLVRETTPETYEAMSDDERRACLDRWNDWVDDMTATGKLAAANPLESGRRLVAGGKGRLVTDGPFSESKELVGGFFLFTDTTLEEVTAMARRCPNLEHGMTVEIRPVAGACHLAHSLGWETMHGPEAAAVEPA